jgi:hypothetical protein
MEVRSEKSTPFWSENLRRRCHLEDLGVNGCLKLNFTLRKQNGGLWAGLTWLTTVSSGDLL